MTDMTARLREMAAAYATAPGASADTLADAADEIGRLQNRIAYLEGLVMTGQGEQIKLAADLLQEKIVRNRMRAAFAPILALAEAIREDAEKATEGPWRVGPVDDTVVTSPGGYEVASIDGDYNEPDLWPIMEANARLIAAAPDMAAAILAAAEAAGGEG